MTSLRLAAHRAAAQWAVLAVVALVTVVAATLLSGFALLLDATQRFAVPAALQDADPARTRVEVRAEPQGGVLEPTARALDTALDQLFGPVPATRTRQVTTDPLSLPRAGSQDALAYFGSYDAVRSQVRLVAGRWPDARSGAGTGGGDLEVAVPRTAAQRLGLQPGSRLRPREVTVLGGRVAVVGVYAVARPGSAYWAHDPLGGATADPAAVVPLTQGLLTTDEYGPFLVPVAAFASDGGPLSAATVWASAEPDFARLPLDQLGPLLQRAAAVPASFAQAMSAATSENETTTELAAVLSGVDRQLLVTRSGVLVTALMLLVVAVAALLLAARLIAERRGAEQALMRARGASGAQLVRLALIEAGAVAVLTTVAAPWLARWLYGLLASRPPLSAAGLAEDPGLPPSTWLVAALASATFALVLVGPLLHRPGTFVEEEQGRARQDRRSVLQRSGVDLGLVVLAAIAYGQLRSYRGAVLPEGGLAAGAARLDPVLVLGPALCLLAGALASVRAVPVLARWAELLATGSRAIVAPLAAWEVGRRARRATGAVLLLTLALSVGTFGLSFLATWQASQQDQADVEVGTDVRASRLAQPPLAQPAAVSAVPGATAVAPVLRTATTLGPRPTDPGESVSGAGSRQAVLLASDPAAWSRVARGRVADGRVDGGLAIEGAARAVTSDADVAGVALPAGTRRLGLHVTARAPGIAVQVGLQLVVQDAAGLRTAVDLPGVRADGRPRTVRAGLRGAPSGGSALSLVAVRAVWHPDVGTEGPIVPEDPGDDTVLLQLRLDGVVATTPGGARPVGAGDVVWDARTTPVDTSVGGAAGGADPLLGEPSADAAGGVVLRSSYAVPVVALGQAPVGVAYTTWATQPALPVVVSGDLLGGLGLSPGDDVALQVGGTVVPATLAGSLAHLPSVPDGPAVLVDLGALGRALLERGDASAVPGEWWAAVPDARAASYTAALRAAGAGQVVSRTALGRERQDEPLRVGTQAALELVVVAAAMFACVGFAMHSTVAVRVRRTEFAQLRALGVSRGALTAVVATESLLLCALGLVLGVGLGALLGWLVGPLVSLSAVGGAPVPPVLVHVPWGAVALLCLEVAALLAAVTLVVALLLRRSVLGPVLRLDAER